MRPIGPLLVIATFVIQIGFISDSFARRISPYQKGGYTTLSESKSKKARRANYIPRSHRFKQRSRAPKSYAPTKIFTSRKGRILKPSNGFRITSQKSQDTFHTLKASTIPFYITVPNHFSISKDQLNWESGTMNLNGKNSQIVIASSGARCDGGSTYARHCLKTKAQKANTALKKKYHRMRATSQKQIALHPSVKAITQPINAYYYALESPYEKLVQLSFIEPYNDFFWTAQIRIPKDRSTDNTINRILYSLFGTPYQEKTRTRTLVKKTTTPTRILRKKRAVNMNLKKSTSHTAQAVPFSIKVPSELKLLKDSLTYSRGKMIFLGNDGAFIKVTATNSKCDQQSVSLSSRCLRTNGSLNAKRIKDQNPGYKVLREELVRLNLTFDSARNENGHLFIALTRNARNAVFTFREPTKKHLWKIEMGTPRDSRNSFLTDRQKIRQITSSLFFRK